MSRSCRASSMIYTRTVLHAQTRRAGAILRCPLQSDDAQQQGEVTLVVSSIGSGTLEVRRFRNGQLEHVFERRVFGNIWDMRTLPMTSIPTTAWEGGGLHDMQVDGVGTLPRHGPGGRGARRGGPWSGAPQDALLISSDSGELCALAVDYVAGSLHCLDSVDIPPAPIHDEIWAGVGGAWAGGGAGGGLDGGFLTRSALGTKIAVDESGTAVAVAAREHWLAVHPLDTLGTSPGHVFARRGAGGGSEWIMVEQMDGAVRDFCFVSRGGYSGAGESSGKGEAILAICLLKHNDGGAGSVILVRACWGGGNSASTHIVATLVPPTSSDLLGDAALGRAQHQENAGGGQGGVGRFLTGVTSVPGRQWLLMVSDEAGARLLDLAPFCGNAQAGPFGNVGEVEMSKAWCRLVLREEGLVSAHACGLAGGQSGSFSAMFVTEERVERFGSEEGSEEGCWAVSVECARDESRGWTCRIVGRRRLRNTMGCAVVLPLRETHGGGGGGGGGGGALYMISPDIGDALLVPWERSNPGNDEIENFASLISLGPTPDMAVVGNNEAEATDVLLLSGMDAGSSLRLVRKGRALASLTDVPTEVPQLTGVWGVCASTKPRPPGSHTHLVFAFTSCTKVMEAMGGCDLCDVTDETGIDQSPDVFFAAAVERQILMTASPSRLSFSQIGGGFTSWSPSITPGEMHPTISVAAAGASLAIACTATGRGGNLVHMVGCWPSSSAGTGSGLDIAGQVGTCSLPSQPSCACVAVPDPLSLKCDGAIVFVGTYASSRDPPSIYAIQADAQSELKVVSSIDLSAYGRGGTGVPQSVECLKDPGGEGMHVLVGLRDGKLISFRCGWDGVICSPAAIRRLGESPVTLKEAMTARGPELVALLQNRAYIVRPGKFSLTTHLLSLPPGSHGGQLSAFCCPPAVPFGLVVVGGDAKMHVCSLDPATTLDNVSFPLSHLSLTQDGDEVMMQGDGQAEFLSRSMMLPTRIVHLQRNEGSPAVAVIACNFLRTQSMGGECKDPPRSELRVMCCSTGAVLCTHGLAPHEKINDVKVCTARWGKSGQNENLVMVGTGVGSIMSSGGVDGVGPRGGRQDRGRILMIRLTTSEMGVVDLVKVATAYVPRVCRALAQHGPYILACSGEKVIMFEIYPGPTLASSASAPPPISPLGVSMAPMTIDDGEGDAWTHPINWALREMVDVHSCRVPISAISVSGTRVVVGDCGDSVSVLRPTLALYTGQPAAGIVYEVGECACYVMQLDQWSQAAEGGGLRVWVRLEVEGATCETGLERVGGLRIDGWEGGEEGGGKRKSIVKRVCAGGRADGWFCIESEAGSAAGGAAVGKGAEGGKLHLCIVADGDCKGLAWSLTAIQVQQADSPWIRSGDVQELSTGAGEERTTIVLRGLPGTTCTVSLCQSVDSSQDPDNKPYKLKSRVSVTLPLRPPARTDGGDSVPQEGAANAITSLQVVWGVPGQDQGSWFARLKLGVGSEEIDVGLDGFVDGGTMQLPSGRPTSPDSTRKGRDKQAQLIRLWGDRRSRAVISVLALPRGEAIGTDVTGELFMLSQEEGRSADNNREALCETALGDSHWTLHRGRLSRGVIDSEQRSLKECLERGDDGAEPDVFMAMSLQGWLVGGVVLHETALVRDLKKIMEVMRTYSWTRPILGHSHKKYRSASAVMAKALDGDLLGLYLELSAVQQEELRVSSGAQSSTLAICELIDSLNMFVAGD